LFVIRRARTVHLKIPPHPAMKIPKLARERRMEMMIATILLEPGN
jgi:hypothetical protein